MEINDYRDDAGADVYGYETFDDVVGEIPVDTDGNEGNGDVEIVGVSFKKNGKIYYFNPVGGSYSQGSNVVVETARGLEYGTVMISNRIVSSKDVTLPLRNVVRAATEADINHYKDNKEKEIDAYNVCVKKIAEHNLSMKLIDVEYTFDNSKLLFYFTADGRIDFRDLVKELASIFKTRIELRQIGIRDEAKIIGGLGMCGRPFCCHSFLNDFVQVSIKMAKEQNLSLNSTKISGACGRLMCCLRYEYDVYEEEIKKTPKVDSCVVTPDGEGVVTEAMPLAGLVKVQLYGKDMPPKVFHRDDVEISVGGRRAVDSREDAANSEKKAEKEMNESETSEPVAKHHSNRRSKQTSHTKNRDMGSGVAEGDRTVEKNQSGKNPVGGDSGGKDLSARESAGKTSNGKNADGRNANGRVPSSHEQTAEKQRADDADAKNSSEEKLGGQSSRPKRRRKDFRNRKRGGNRSEKAEKADRNGNGEKSEKVDRTDKSGR